MEEKQLNDNTWIIIGILATGFAAGIIPYVFRLKAVKQQQSSIIVPKTFSKETTIKQETSGQQSPNITTGATSANGSINRKSSGTQSPNNIAASEAPLHK
jgi:hypothetical protein